MLAPTSHSTPLAIIGALISAIKASHFCSICALVVDFGSMKEMLASFEAAHMQQFGFIAPEKSNIVEALTVEVIGGGQDVEDAAHSIDPNATAGDPLGHADMYAAGEQRQAAVYNRDG